MSEHQASSEEHVVSQDRAPGTGPRPAGAVAALILDYGNVLYTWEAAGALAGRVSLAQWDEFVASGEFDRLNTLSDAGVPFQDILDDLGRARPDRGDWQQLLRVYWEHFADSTTGPVPGMARVVDALLEAGVPLYALTNYNDRLFAATRWMVPQLERFRGVVVSGEEHLVKPDPALYRRLLERYGLEPDATLFVDDSPANIEGARAVGLQTHLFVGAGRLRAELIERGLLAAPDPR